MDTAFDLDERRLTAKMTAALESPGSIEAALARIWAGVLELDHVDRHENFFLLGGDSLRAAVLFAEVESVFRVRLPPDAVYDEGETVAGMALMIGDLAPQRGQLSKPCEAPAAATERIFRGRGRAMQVRAPVIEKRDLFTAAKIVALAIVACVPGKARRLSLCRRLAAGLMALRRSRDAHLEDVVPMLTTPTTPSELETAILADGYEAIVETWRDHVPWIRPQITRLRGGAHIEAALAAGRGAVLWNCPTGAGSRPGLRALARAGLPIAQLMGNGHPFSPSRFAMKFLNPLVNRMDDRYVGTTVTVREDNAVEAMHALGEHLRANGVIRISANGAFGNALDIPFFGGTLHLSLGAPMLALLHGAPLIPIFCIPDGTGGHELVAEAPLTDGSEEASLDHARALAGRYAAILESYLERYPHIWRCWFIPNTWEPAGRGEIDDA